MQRTGTYRWRRIISYLFPFVLLVVFVLVDQFTKYYFKNLWQSNGNTVVIKDFFVLTYTINTGAAWSFLSGVSWAQTFFKVLTVVSLVLFGVFMFYAFKKDYKFLKYALVLVVAGTIGNFIDRLLLNGVIDFLSFSFWGWDFPVFNIADSCLTVGVVMIIIHYCFIDKDALFKKRANDNEANDSEAEVETVDKDE